MTGVLSNWRGYLELTKPGVQALLFVSCASGMLIGSDFNPPIEVFFFGLIGIKVSFFPVMLFLFNIPFDFIIVIYFLLNLLFKSVSLSNANY